MGWDLLVVVGCVLALGIAVAVGFGRNIDRGSADTISSDSDADSGGDGGGD